MAGRLVRKVNDLKTMRPDIAAQWHLVKNESIRPEDVTISSGYKAWWQCIINKNHEWEAYVFNRTRKGRGSNCPYCSGRKAITGVNDLSSYAEYRYLLEEWDLTLNDYAFTELLPFSHKDIWWKCFKDSKHIWLMKLSERTSKNRGCPDCRKIPVDYIPSIVSDIKSWKQKYENLVLEWHPDNKFGPEYYTETSGQTIRWRCLSHEDHEWSTTIAHRTKGRTRCPFCANRIIKIGFNDLKTKRPDIAAQWHQTKNGSKTPEMFSEHSNQSIWWQCINNPCHEWKTTINNRSKSIKATCSKCTKIEASGIEELFRKYIQEKYMVEAISLKIRLEGFKRLVELDILGVYKGQKVVIEYDGNIWHSGKYYQKYDMVKRDVEKTLALLNNDYLVIRIRQGNLQHLDIQHNSLYQTSYNYSSSPKNIIDKIDEIFIWVDSKL